MSDFKGHITEAEWYAWLPHGASTIAPEIDRGWYVSYWISVVFFFLLIIPMTYFVWKYRRTKTNQVGAPTGHNTPLEIFWSVVPLVLVMGCFLEGFRGYIKASVPPAGAYEINVTAHQWQWAFAYPNGVNTIDELHVPKGIPTRLIMSSQDVIHSFYIAEFRVKQDVVPGSYSSVWFEPTETGEFTVECTEYCGGVGQNGHSTMLAKVLVQEPGDFKKWLDEQEKAQGGEPTAEKGEALFKKMGCNVCHSLTDTLLPGGGPSFKNVWGRKETMSSGEEITVNEDYVKESILFPQAKIVKGFGPIMPSFKGQLRDDQIGSIIAYLKTTK